MLCVQPCEPAGLIQRFVYACQLRQWESKCGMRRPSLGQNEDDLSRLTTVISPTTASLSSAQTEHDEGCDNGNNGNCGNGGGDCGGKQHLLQQHQQHGGSSDSNGAISTVSQYLPNLINSSEWQNCRKRKERQDSTSSISQDRKLIRSNSEEHLPNCGEVIRRVSSHEDFKKPAPLIEISVNKENIIEEAAEEQHLQLEEEQQQQIFEKNLKNSSENLKKFFIGSESLCAASREVDGGQTTTAKSDPQHHHLTQSNHLSHHNHYNRHRLSPCRDVLRSHKDSDSELDGEHERRRHCERFSKTRPPSGRKSVSPRNRTKHSKHSSSSGKDKSGGGGGGNDHFYSKHDSHHSIKHERRGYGKRDKASEREKTPEPDAVLLADFNDNNLLEKGNESPREKQLPWDQSFQDDTGPVVCQRFADHNFEHATKMGGFGEVRSLPPNATMKHHISYRSTDLHPAAAQKPIVPEANNMFDERIKAINRKLSTLKKKLNSYEDRFERDNGFRPAHGDKTSDSSIRPVVVEIHKLRKEKNQIKADLAVFNAKAAKLAAAAPAASPAGTPGDDETGKLYQMKDTIADIEKVKCRKKPLADIFMSKVERIPKGCRGAIKHCSESTDPKALDQLRKEIRNAPYHVYGYHRDCRNYFCPRAGEDGAMPSVIIDLQNEGVWQQVMLIMEKLAAKAEQLCEHRTSNLAENVFCRLCKYNLGKRMNLMSRGSWNRRVIITVLQCNENYKWHESYMEAYTGQSPGYWTKKMFDEKHKKLQSTRMAQNSPDFCRKSAKQTEKEEDYGADAVEAAETSAAEYIVDIESFEKFYQITPQIRKQLENCLSIKEMDVLSEGRIFCNFVGDVINCQSITKTKKAQNMLLATTNHNYLKFNRSITGLVVSQVQSDFKLKLEENLFFIDPCHPYICCAPDAVSVDRNTILIIKRKDSKSDLKKDIYSSAGTLGVKVKNNDLVLDRNTTVQVQSALHVTQANSCLVFVMYGTDVNNYFHKMVQHEPDFFKDKVAEKIDTFVKKHICKEMQL